MTDTAQNPRPWDTPMIVPEGYWPPIHFVTDYGDGLAVTCRASWPMEPGSNLPHLTERYVPPLPMPAEWNEEG